MNSTEVSYRLARRVDLDLLVKAGSDLFDHPINKALAREFLGDSRHVMLLAIDAKEGGIID